MSAASRKENLKQTFGGAIFHNVFIRFLIWFLISCLDQLEEDLIKLLPLRFRAVCEKEREEKKKASSCESRK